MPLFEVAIVELPEQKKDEDRGMETLVFGPKAIVAPDSQGAAINAVLEDPDALRNVDRNRMKVLVRPFV